MITIWFALVSLAYAPVFIGANASIPPTEKSIIRKTVCEPGNAYRMFGYDCSYMDLTEVPQNLKSSVKIFDLSINRIKELTKKSFTRYSDIKLLYLFENRIKTIEKGTFAHLTGLEAIDLSSNSLSSISVELFKLPRLRNIYYSDNPLLKIGNDLKHLEKPITAPLQKLFMAYCDLSSIPDLGILPDLVYLNVSFNLFDEITPQQFSPLCSLNTLVIENSTHLSPCTCKSLQAYLDRRLIYVNHTFDCPTVHEEVYCSESVNATADTDDFDKCLTRVQEKKRDEQAKETWMLIVIGLGVFFIVFICILYYFHRRNVKKAKLLEKQSTKLRHIHQTTNGNVEVLLSRAE
ncbi:chondroadherin-like isoform X2 [Sitodiplosis mosellana]|uniref:chondroadherin-like isoform X2 n=1 Tax=Sitodiplosis mosellana TaxID=263140 RepID=UPI0024449C87|nr:chondroadherin-like isoform X2 [Sitodiplosis mosellana]